MGKHAPQTLHHIPSLPMRRLQDATSVQGYIHLTSLDTAVTVVQSAHIHVKVKSHKEAHVFHLVMANSVHRSKI